MCIYYYTSLSSGTLPHKGLVLVAVVMITARCLWCLLLNVLFRLAELNLSGIGAKLKRTDGLCEVGLVGTDGDKHARLKDKTGDLNISAK